MQAKSWIMLRVLLNRFHGGAQESLLRSLPDEQAQIVSSQNVDSTEIFPAFTQPSELIHEIHYSWLTPIITQFPHELQSILISSLPDMQKERLSQQFQIELSADPVADSVKKFLTQLIYSKLRHSDVLPLEYLPTSPLKSIASLDKRQLQHLFDYLGLFDLALEIPQIVDKKKLRDIYNCLSTKKQRFLRQCTRQKELVQSQKLNLDAWDGDPKRLNKVLHRRGIIRLGYALSGQHPDLVWHITHTLDTGRAEVLAKHFSQKEIPKVTQALAQQVLNLVHYLQESGTL